MPTENAISFPFLVLSSSSPISELKRGTGKTVAGRVSTHVDQISSTFPP